MNFENSFKNVSSLYLDYSSLISFQDLSFSYFSIQFLFLGNQKIEKLVENSLKGSYTKLDLSFNLLSSSSFEMQTFGFLPNLNEISFSNNLITDLDFDDAFQFPMAEINLLNFQHNQISSIKEKCPS